MTDHRNAATESTLGTSKQATLQETAGRTETDSTERPRRGNEEAGEALGSKRPLAVVARPLAKRLRGKQAAPKPLEVWEEECRSADTALAPDKPILRGWRAKHVPASTCAETAAGAAEAPVTAEAVPRKGTSKSPMTPPGKPCGGKQGADDAGEAPGADGGSQPESVGAAMPWMKGDKPAVEQVQQMLHFFSSVAGPVSPSEVRTLPRSWRCGETVKLWARSFIRCNTPAWFIAIVGGMLPTACWSNGWLISAAATRDQDKGLAAKRKIAMRQA